MNDGYQSDILVARYGKATTEALMRKTCPSASFDNPTHTDWNQTQASTVTWQQLTI